MSLQVLIVSRYHIVHQGEANMVMLPTINGQIGILEKHTRLFTKLQTGVITVRNEEGEIYFTSTGGIAEVRPNRVWILTDSSENVDEIDVERAAEARTRAEDAMKTTTNHHSTEFLKALMMMKKAQLRMRASARYKGKSYRSNRRPYSSNK